MKLMKYKDLLTCAKEKISEALAPLKAREMYQKGKYKIAGLESEIAEHEQKIQEACSKFPIDFDEIIKLQNNLDLKNRLLKQMNTLLETLFDK